MSPMNVRQSLAGLGLGAIVALAPSLAMAQSTGQPAKPSSKPETTVPIEPAMSSEPANPGAAKSGAAKPGAAAVDRLREFLPTCKAPALKLDEAKLLRTKTAKELELAASEPLSLADAIAITEASSCRIRQRELELDQSKLQLKQAKAANKPQLSTNVSAQASGSDTQSNILKGARPGGTFSQAEETSSFGHQGQLSATGNVRVDLSLIDPAQAAQVREAEVRIKQAELAIGQEQEQLRFDVSQDYYNLQKADEQVGIAKKAIETAERSLKDAQALERAGVGTRFSVLQSEVQLANEQQTLENAIGARNKASRQLSKRLGLVLPIDPKGAPREIEVQPQDRIQPAGDWTLTLEPSIEAAQRNRAELARTRLNLDIADAQRDRALAATKPTLAFFAQYGLNETLGVSRSEANEQAGFGTSSGGNPRVTNQFGQSYAAGVNFRWLFNDGGGAQAAASQRERDRTIAAIAFDSNKGDVHKQVRDAFFDLQSNKKSITTAEKSVQQAEEALRLARLRFQAGVGTQTDVLTQERDLTRALGNRINAIIDYNLAFIAIKRAVSEPLPEGAAIESAPGSSAPAKPSPTMRPLPTPKASTKPLSR
jgi:outer membrane protein TolC